MVGRPFPDLDLYSSAPEEASRPPPQSSRTQTAVSGTASRVEVIGRKNRRNLGDGTYPRGDPEDQPERGKWIGDHFPRVAPEDVLLPNGGGRGRRGRNPPGPWCRVPQGPGPSFFSGSLLTRFRGTTSVPSDLGRGRPVVGIRSLSGTRSSGTIHLTTLPSDPRP